MLDVCLILEGTYPYVAGGVSTWAHQLISSMGDLRFGVVYIAPSQDPTRTLKYKLPSHIVYFKEVYLHDYHLSPRAKRKPRQQDYELTEAFYSGLSQNNTALFGEFIGLFQGEDACFDTRTFFSAKEIWEILNRFYKRWAPEISYLDYFWTFRGIHLPVLQILQAEVPKAKIYHSLSTGYAGLLGAIAKASCGGKYFLTEHGIYTFERMLEISQSSWIYEEIQKTFRAERELSFFKRLWLLSFEIFGRLAYAHSDLIFTLFEANKTRQVLSGADPQKVTIIPNGIDVKYFSSIVRQRKPHPQVGLVGRVVSIKDIKTFIRAAELTRRELPQAHFWIIGPTDEEPDYFEECKILVSSLGLEAYITFAGRVDIRDYYSFLDLVVLTSLSEAQPYVILEANILGIPVVASDVGACREMLEGRDSEDQALGASGLLTDVSNPKSCAEAIATLLGDKELYRRLGEAGKKRVAHCYDQDDLISRYLNVYEKNL